MQCQQYLHKIDGLLVSWVGYGKATPADELEDWSEVSI